jgi:hypothetical protein
MTVVQPSPTTTTQTSPSPPESPQQIEDTVSGIREAVVFRTCTGTCADGGCEFGVGGGGAGGRNGYSHGHGVRGRGVRMGAERASTPGGSGWRRHSVFGRGGCWCC